MIFWPENHQFSLLFLYEDFVCGRLRLWILSRGRFGMLCVFCTCHSFSEAASVGSGWLSYWSVGSAITCVCLLSCFVVDGLLPAALAPGLLYWSAISALAVAVWPWLSVNLTGCTVHAGWAYCTIEHTLLDFHFLMSFKSHSVTEWLLSHLQLTCWWSFYWRAYWLALLLSRVMLFFWQLLFFAPPLWGGG